MIALFLSGMVACSTIDSIKCQYCDATNDMQSNYCSSCGEKLLKDDKENEVTLAIERDIIVAKSILATANQVDLIKLFPNAVPDEDGELLIYSTFSGIDGYYEIYFNDNGEIHKVIFRYGEEEFDAKQVADSVCDYLGDFFEYNPKYDSYKWKNEEINIIVSFYPSDGIWFDLVSRKVIEESALPVLQEDTPPEEDLYALVEKYISEEDYSGALSLLAMLDQTDETTQQEKECKYQLATQQLQNGNKKEAYIAFYELGNYKDAPDNAKVAAIGIEKSLYTMGVEYYLDGLYDNAKSCFSGCIDYEDTQTYLKYIQKMVEYQGVYESIKDAGIRPWRYLVLEGNKLIVYDFFGNDPERSVYDIAITEYDGKLCIVSKFDVAEPHNAIIWRYLEEVDGEPQLRERSISDSWRDEGEFYRKIDSTRAALDRKYYGTERAKEPAIGMTAAEVEQSTWGKPIRINKTTFDWGTTEQWVYLAHRYIYFKNGKVFAISE